MFTLSPGLEPVTWIWGRIVPQAISGALGRHSEPLLKRAELPPIRFHDLGYTCATILLMVGKHPKYVQEIPAHASINITLDTCSYVIEGMDGGPADAMDEVL